MATTVSFRVTEDEKKYLYDLIEGLEVPVSKFLKDAIRDLMAGKLTYDGESIKATANNMGDNSTTTTKIEGVDITELLDIAKKRSVTPQSVLNNALRPYR